MQDYASELAAAIDVETYDDETKAFICSSGAIGFCWLTEPLSFVNADVEEQFRSLLRIDYPDDALLSVHLIADDHLDFFYQDFTDKRKRNGLNLVSDSTKVRLDFLKQMQSKSAIESAPCTLRNFILVFSLKMKHRGDVDRSVLSHFNTYSEKVGQMIKEIFGTCLKLDQKDWLANLKTRFY